MENITDRKEQRERLVRAWFAAWLEVDGSRISEMFAENTVYSECYGPEYRGRAQIESWFDDWNRRGRVLEWRIKRFLHDGDTAVVEWYFCCSMGGAVDDFDGVSLVDFDAEGRIARLCEFQSKAEHEFPYGE